MDAGFLNAEHIGLAARTQQQILALQILCDAAASADPIAEEVAYAKVLANEDELLLLALDSIPSAALEHGVPTLTELQVQFRDDVKPGTLAAAYAWPGQDNAFGLAWGMLISSFVWTPPTDMCSDDDRPDHILERAQSAIDRGDLRTCIQEMRKVATINDTAAVCDASEKWLSQVEDRSVLLQTLDLVRAHLLTITVVL